jgi:hypothetical protein
MLAFLQGSGRLSDRKARLSAAACCRRLWHLLGDGRSRRAVEVAEAFADGDVDVLCLQDAHAAAGRAAVAAHWKNLAGPVQTATEAAVPTAAERVGPDEARSVMDAVAEATGDQATDDRWAETWTPGKSERERRAAEQAIHSEGERQEREAQVALLRCIFGSPFGPPPSLDACLTPRVLALAEAAYADRVLPSGALATDRLAALAAALQDAGCTDAGLLGHLRGEGPHVRGCVAVDAVLGRG